MPRAAVTANSALALLGRYWRDSRPRHCSRADIPAWGPKKSHYCIIITTWRGITCRIAITFEGVENPYLPGNVHFQYRPLGDIGVAVVAGAIRNASR